MYRREGSTVAVGASILRPRHIVMATGVNGIPNIPTKSTTGPALS
jgi:deoxycytidylate deaminase